MVSQIFIKVHEDMPDHPKIEPLSDKAFRLLIETWCWCKRMSNDGMMTNSTWKRRGTSKTRAELERAGLVEPDQNSDFVFVHDFLDWQSSKAQIEANRDAKERGSYWGNHLRWHVNRNITDLKCEFCRIGPPIGDASVHRSVTDSGADRSDAADGSVTESIEVEGEVEGKKKTSSPASRATVDDPDFERFWQAYPRKVGKGEARKAWAKVIKAGVTIEQVLAGVESYKQDLARRRVEPSFIKHPGPWLNAERWSDQLNGNELIVEPQRTAWWDN